MGAENLPFKMEILLEQCGGQKVVVESVLEEFLSQVPTDTAEMEACLAGGNLLQTSKAAHRLKGTAGVLGAIELHSLCAALEIAGKESKAEDAAEIYPKLKAEAQRCVEAVPTAKSLL